MGDHGNTDEDEAEAQVQLWKYAFGFTEMAVVRCAIQLGIPDLLERQQNQTMSLHALSSSLACSPSSLYRIMRFLTRRGIFKQIIHSPSPNLHHDEPPTTSTYYYAQTPLSRLLRSTGENTMAALVLFESSPVMLAPWQNLKDRVLDHHRGSSPFDAAHGQDVWQYARNNPGHSELLNEAMSCDARFVVSTLLDNFSEVFDGIGTLVDVGGGDGTALRTLIRARPGIRGINFDVPHVVSVAPGFQGIQHVGGDFFKCVPKADAAFIMWVLHDWGDDECIKILKNCREAVPPNAGKVIILEAVIDDDDDDVEEEDDNNKKKMQQQLKDVGLMLDMIMMAHTTTGKERTAKEWAYVLDQAGFSRHTVKRIPAAQSVIQAYP